MLKALVLGVLTFAGCGDDTPANPAPFDPEITELVMRPAVPIVAAGRTIQLVAEAHTADGYSYDQNSVVTWASSDESLLTVSDIGKAHGVAEGTATVTATHPDGPMASVDVQILAADVATVAVCANPDPTCADVEPTPVELVVGDTVQLVATATLLDDTTQDVTDAANWACTNLAAASVDNETDVSPEKGLTTGVEAGTATLAATFLGIRGSVSVTVVPADGG